MISKKFKHCHVDSSTGLMWCQYHNGTWTPPFRVSVNDSSQEYVKTPSQEDQIQDEATTKVEKL